MFVSEYFGLGDEFDKKEIFDGIFIWLFYIMDNRNIIHIYVIRKSVRYIEDKHGEERN